MMNTVVIENNLYSLEYFQKLLNSAYPMIKVAEVSEWHFIGSSADMNDPRYVYYGWWTFRCSQAQTPFMTFANHSNTSEVRHVLPHNREGSLDEESYHNGGWWFGLGSYLSDASGDALDQNIAFHGWRSRVDWTPRSVGSPVQFNTYFQDFDDSNPEQVFASLVGPPNTVIPIKLVATVIDAGTATTITANAVGADNDFPSPQQFVGEVAPFEVEFDVTTGADGVANFNIDWAADGANVDIVWHLERNEPATPANVSWNCAEAEGCVTSDAHFGN